MNRWPLLLALVAIGGCATVPPPVDPFTEQLARAASAARAALQQHAQVQNALADETLSRRQKQAVLDAYTTTPDGMDTVMTLTSGFVGGIEEAITLIAKATGYRVEVLGRRPVEAVIVTLPPGQAYAVTLYRDAKWQAGRHSVQILPVAATKTLQVRYVAES